MLKVFAIIQVFYLQAPPDVSIKQFDNMTDCLNWKREQMVHHLNKGVLAIEYTCSETERKSV